MSALEMQWPIFITDYLPVDRWAFKPYPHPSTHLYQQLFIKQGMLFWDSLILAPAGLELTV